jgi:hypothetical protein
LSSRLLKRGPDATDTTSDADKTSTVFRYPLHEVISVKKESRLDIGVFDTDGLQITFADEKVIRLASVARRDDAFAYILGRARCNT